jgi:hypothetical protein
MSAVAGFKIPAAWDQNRPKFDGETINSLRIFIRNCETVFTSGGITDEQEKKNKLLEYLDHVDIREQWQKLPKFPAPHLFTLWKEEILTLYPEIEDMNQGSLQKLTVICDSNRPISRSELGKLRRFAVAFTNEAEKLLKGTALIVNMTLVDWILSVLEVTFATELENAMNQAAIVTVTHPPAAPVAGQAPTGLQLADRRGDRLPYKQVLQIADLIADNWVGRNAKSLLGSNSRLNSTIGIAVPAVSMDSIKVKAEIADRMDSFAGELARMKDTAELHEKRIGESIRRVETSIESSLRQLNQSLREKPPHMDQSGPPSGRRNDDHQGQNSGSNNNSAGNRERGPCYFCNGPHLINECVTKDEFIDFGWITVENGLVKLGNGNWIPRYPDHISRMQKVEDHYRKQGITRDSPSIKRANMVETFYSTGNQGPSQQNDSYNHSRVDHLYDTIDDEIRSAKVQQMVRLRALNQNQRPVVSQNYNVPFIEGPTYHNPSPEITLGTNMVQAIPQFQQMLQGTQPVSNVSNVSTVGNLDLNQLIQLLNIVGGGNRSGTSVQEQMVMTRGGATSDPPAKPHF